MATKEKVKVVPAMSGTAITPTAINDSTSKIRGLNVLSGTGNPVKITDLAGLYDAVAQTQISTQNSTQIMSGFIVSGTAISAGIISYNGRPYYFRGGTIGQVLYIPSVSPAQVDERTAEDGQTYFFYSDYIAQSGASAPSGSTLIGTMALVTLNIWKSSYIAARQITGAQMALNTILHENIGAEQIQDDNILSQTLLNRSFASQSVDERVLAPDSVTTSKILDNSITPDKLTGGIPGNLFSDMDKIISYDFVLSNTTGEVMQVNSSRNTDLIEVSATATPAGDGYSHTIVLKATNSDYIPDSSTLSIQSVGFPNNYIVNVVIQNTDELHITYTSGSNTMTGTQYIMQIRLKQI